MDTTIRQTFPVTIPESEVKFFKQIAKKMGWSVGKRKKTGMEEALEDIKAGKVSGPYSSTDELFNSLGIHV